MFSSFLTGKHQTSMEFMILWVLNTGKLIPSATQKYPELKYFNKIPLNNSLLKSRPPTEFIPKRLQDIKRVNLPPSPSRISWRSSTPCTWTPASSLATILNWQIIKTSAPANRTTRRGTCSGKTAGISLFLVWTPLGREAFLAWLAQLFLWSLSESNPKWHHKQRRRRQCCPPAARTCYYLLSCVGYEHKRGFM